MAERIAGRYFSKVAFWALTGLVLLSIGVGSANAQAPESMFTTTVQVVIQEKTKAEVFAQGNMRFSITPLTKIVKGKAWPLTISSLPVPCKAKIQFQPTQNEGPRAIKITVLNLLPGASSDRWGPSPE